MCGINGVFAFDETGKESLSLLDNSLSTLKQRGPDAQKSIKTDDYALGHTRLSIIDTSTAANQPFTDESGRYLLVFNGEIFNYKQLSSSYLQDVSLHTTSDTEVLLHLLMKFGVEALPLLHGFFAFCFYDTFTKKALLARDRMGKKPLVFYHDSHRFVFASEIKAIEQFKLPLTINKNIVYQYFKYNYNPHNRFTIYNQIFKIEPGSWGLLNVINGHFEIQSWYALPENDCSRNDLNYNTAQEQLADLMEKSVLERLEADVPLGAFLSGGLDSSIVAALASKYVSKLKTFSITFKQNPFYDESYYSNLVAKKYATEHTEIEVDNNTLFDNLFNLLNNLDEPFADSSALAMYVLCKESSKYVKVALSGDGADELFAGYNKYEGHLKASKYQQFSWLFNTIVAPMNLLPSSRSGLISNKVRQLRKFSEGLKLNQNERFLRFCAIMPDSKMNDLFSEAFLADVDEVELENISNSLSISKHKIFNINDILLRDQKMVLPNDMLVKVDLTSMASGLEVRSPFLSHAVVEFANSLPVNYKINSGIRKKILQDTFKNQLPEELYNRPKKGFDVPMVSWFKNELNSFVFNNLLEVDFIEKQGIFNKNYILKLKDSLQNSTDGDIQAKLWALLVFQYWYKARF